MKVKIVFQKPIAFGEKGFYLTHENTYVGIEKIERFYSAINLLRKLDTVASYNESMVIYYETEEEQDTV